MEELRLQNAVLTAELAAVKGELAGMTKSRGHYVSELDIAMAERDAAVERGERLGKALREIADAEENLCHSCDGEGNRYADGKAHYYSEHAATIPCPECYGAGRIPELTAQDMREVATAALAAREGE